MIEARNLTRQFGQLTAVADISFRVPPGSVLALLGPNGAGKTTTVRMLCALLAPSSGSAMVAGYDVCAQPTAVRARVGLVTDVPGLFEHMTLGDYLDFFGRVYGLNTVERSQRIAALLGLFELAGERDRELAGFSRGMKQKVALARALIHEPPVLFLDEPTSGLDPLSARTVRALIADLKHARRSIVLCTHDLYEAERLADMVAIVRHGQMVSYDTPANLRRSGTVQVRIELAAPCIQAVELVQGIAGVEQPQLLSSSLDGLAAGSAHLVYTTCQPRESNPQVVARLTGAGAQIVTVTCETRSLEDVYAAALVDHTGI